MKKINTTRLSLVLLLFGLLLTVLVKGIGSIIESVNKDAPEESPSLDYHSENISYKTFGTSIPFNYSIHGIDVSKHQQNIDWKQVESMRVKGVKLSFAFIKASEGATRIDENFQKNWRAVGNTRLLRGAYHFFRPIKDPKIQAALFMRQVKLKKGDLPPVVDIENDNRQSTVRICQNLQKFMDIRMHSKSL